MPLERRSELVEPLGQLQVDVHGDVGPVGEERERLVERRECRSDLPQLGERTVAHRPGGNAVTDLVEVVRVSQHEGPADEVEHVELDRVHAHSERGLEGGERVLRREQQPRRGGRPGSAARLALKSFKAQSEAEPRRVRRRAPRS